MADGFQLFHAALEKGVVELVRLGRTVGGEIGQV
jgi:hypothetical protein